MSKTLFKKLSNIIGKVATGRSFGRMFVVAIGLTTALTIGVNPASASPKYAGIVIDAKTGKVLYGADPDGLRYPASLTKMMTLYMTFEALEAGRITLNSRVPISANAAKEPPSKLGVRSGSSVTVEQAILALVTRSANDVATALGEFVGGSEDRFARQMTAKARALGMTKTTYRNAHGLPNTAQMTTARDQARLSVALRQHFPQYYGYFSTRSFKYGKSVIGNHNRLLGNVKGVDGIKTGYTRAAGSNLATSAQLDGRSIVAVVLGAKSSAARDSQMRKLVAQYLPKASRGGRTTNVIAQTEIAPAANNNQEIAGLPRSGPVPQVRYDDYDSSASAFAAPTKSPAIAALEDVTRPTPSANTLTPPAPIETVKPTIRATDVDNIVTASTASAPSSGKTGWVIQIGASPNQDSALSLLQSAQEKGGKLLSSAEPFTIAFNNNGEQVYRARFGGFNNQDAAVNACNALKKKGMSCWASLQ